MNGKGVSDEERLVAVAALMHDIGKFMQRGNRYKHDFPHPQYSEMFFYPETGFNISESEEFIDGVKFLVRHHHEEDLDKLKNSGGGDSSEGSANERLRILAEIISEADNISSREREELKGRNLPLMKPIFLEIGLSNSSNVTEENKAEQGYYFKISPLEFSKGEETVIPEKGKLSNEQIEGLYKAQWQAFKEEFKKVLKRTKGRLNPDALYYIMEKYLWCVPSAYFNSVPDVSLFEHSKITSGVAVSMLRFLKERYSKLFEMSDVSDARNNVRKIVKDADEKRYLLVGIDVNGIQKFIYSISSKKALKSLKGRSIFVQFITNLIVHNILWDEEVNLYESNIVYMGGGKAYLILPVTVEKRLKELADEIEKSLFEKFGNGLSVTIGWVEASANDFIRSNMSDTWRKLMNTLADRRTHKYSKIIQSDFASFFNPEESGGEFNEDGVGKGRVICPICRKEVPESETKKLLPDGIKVCKECYTYISIGDKLKLSHLYAIVTSGILQDGAEISLPHLPVKIYITEKPVKQNGSNRMLTLNMTSTNLAEADGFMLNAGGKPPVSELSEFIDESDGFKRIGILKMDVDSLGEIMTSGIKNNENRTLSRISQLSSSISIFFKGYLRKVLSQEEFKDKVYAIYAGGDDLFAVGNWRAIPEFAKKVRNDFKRFVCENPDISISGGIFMIKDKYPIARGASYADDAEEEAKNYNYKSHKKDAIYFLGKALSWNDFEVAERIKDELVNYTAEAKKKSAIHKLKRIYHLYERSLNVLSKKEISEEDIERKARWSKWVWILAYYVGRENDGNILSMLRSALATDVFDGLRSERQIISYLDVPVNWADLSTRR